MVILSAAQFRPRFASCRADVTDNVRRAEPLMHEASRLGAQLLVFPELAFTGYSFLGPEDAFRIAEAIDGPTFRAMRGVASELQCYVAWGYVEVDGESLYNSCSMVGPDGELVTSYRKVNLWGNDFLWATPGREAAPLAVTDLGRTSVIVCRDLRDKIPDNLPSGRTAAKSQTFWRGKQVDVVAACTNWGKGGFPSTTWMDFAADHACNLVVANRWGDEENGAFRQDFGQGGSCIVQPDWKVHTSGMKWGQDCLVTAAVGSKVELPQP